MGNSGLDFVRLNILCWLPITASAHNLLIYIKSSSLIWLVTCLYGWSRGLVGHLSAYMQFSVKANLHCFQRDSLRLLDVLEGD